jgi:hypothetical protein
MAVARGVHGVMATSRGAPPPPLPPSSAPSGGAMPDVRAADAAAAAAAAGHGGGVRRSGRCPKARAMLLPGEELHDGDEWEEWSDESERRTQAAQHVKRGDRLRRRGGWRRAIAEYRRAVNIDANCADAW